ncbi:MAG TPA: hypothetical protein VEV41_25690 [Terriglobales bacterium]|nr:hypothetical protein [Terriglobales bacterium]
MSYAVVGLSQEEVLAGPEYRPAMQLARALDEHVERLKYRGGAGGHALVYGVDATDIETIRKLRQRYHEYGPFFQFEYFNDVARVACEQFGTELRILEYVTERSIPHSRTLLLDRLYVRAA